MRLLFAFNTTRKRLLLPVLCLVLGACGQSAAQQAAGAEGEPASSSTTGLTLDLQARDNLGIQIQALGMTEFQDVREGPGQVMNTIPVVQALSAWQSAQVTATTRREARDRAEKLFKADAAGSREALDFARQDVAAAEAALVVARATLGASYGMDAPWQEAGALDGALASLVAGNAVLVKAGFPDGLPGGIPTEVSFRRIGMTTGGNPWTSRDVWAGPADPSVPGPVVFAWLEGDELDVFAGERLAGVFPVGEPLSGIDIPREAIVYAGGVAWCFIFQAPDRFLRREVDISRPDRVGYFQLTGFAPGEQVVIRGAGLLMASETTGSGGGN